MRMTWARNCPCVAFSMPRSRYSIKLRKPVLYTASLAKLALNNCFGLLVAIAFSLARGDGAYLVADHIPQDSSMTRKCKRILPTCLRAVCRAGLGRPYQGLPNEALFVQDNQYELLI